jgi:hypothetical protein
MKKFNFVALLLVAFMLSAVCSFATDSNVYQASPGAESTGRSYAVSAAMVTAGENAVFDKLVKKTLVSVGTATTLCPQDATSTGTAAIAYMADVTPPCRVVVTPYDSSTASLTFDLYSTSNGSVVAPDTDCLLPITNGRYEMTCFGMPNVEFGANQTGTMTVEVWVPSY